MKKKRIALVALITLSLLLSSCAGKDDKGKNEQSDKEQKILQVENNSKTEDENAVASDDTNISKGENDIESSHIADDCERLGFENASFLSALSNALGKDTSAMTIDDIESIHYIAIGDDGNGNFSLFTGYIDYVDAMFSQIQDENELLSLLNERVMMSDFDYDGVADLTGDLAKFKNLEVFELYDIKLEDVSFIKNYETLALGYFKNNSITDISSLSDYSPETLFELDFTGNDISDWSALYHIKDKVTVYYDSTTGFTSKLSDMLESEGEKQDENEQNSGIVFVDGDGNEANLGSLFD